ncbi:beta-galactosidase GalA [Sphingopyxis sp. JAI128]|uniref:beta-galactosidase GalA n=1 Tax=Sphingopyxis sp. JAI128 TaxID=2723066 RepID=UPI001619D8B5
MKRREFIASAGFVAALAPAVGVEAASLKAGRHHHLPMPAPRTVLPSRQEADEPGRLLLDRAWQFHRGDIPFPEIKGHGWTYSSAKAGQAQGPAATNFDDSDWQTVDLPHDWAVDTPFDKDANPSQGYRRRGYAWYRRTLRLEPEDRGKYIELQFGAIATNATIWFNGSVIAHNWSGYNSINLDLTPTARFGDHLNTIVVRVDAEKMEGWWYEGAGIYRHAWLAKRPPVYIETDGIHADPRLGPDGRWTVPVTATLGNILEGEASATVSVELTDAEGRLIAGGSAEATVPPLGTQEARLDLAVTDPKLWSVDTPNLYTLRARLTREGQHDDLRTMRIGFRTFRFDADQGFFLNGEPLKIKGTCNHQDHAGVGVAMPDTLWEWRIQRLKAMGSNAIRCSHHAPATELLDACDRLGMLVMDENRNFNTSPDYMAQLRWLVRRDRNRPSVFMWSVFNEEPMQGTGAGYEMVRRMAAEVKALDDSRPVTAAMNAGLYAPKNVSQAVDVVGFNYQQGEYDRFHAANPKLPLISSEDTSAFMTRGAFESDPEKHVIASYDDTRSDWGNTHRQAWKAIAERPFVAGAFVWTGFDYRGEPTPYEWPSASSFFGIMDLCGFPKTAFLLHRAQWVDDRPLIDIAPHWNWAGREGQPVTVMVPTNVERVRLVLNGKTVGEEAVDRFDMPRWQVPYEPGRLEAIGYRGGREVARAVVETTGAPVALRLTPDRMLMAGDGEDVQPVTIDAVDAKGRHVATAHLPVSFAISGGDIIGHGNGDPNSHEPEKGNHRRLFNGLAQLIVRSDAAKGPLVVTASAAGLRSARVNLHRLPATPREQVPATPSVQVLEGWRQSPPSREKPDPDMKPSDTDMNSWLWLNTGELHAAQEEARWVVVRTSFTPRHRAQARGGTLKFSGIVGRAEVWLDGKRIADKQGYGEAALEAPLPPGNAERIVTLLVENEPGRPGGLAKAVAVADRR